MWGVLTVSRIDQFRPRSSLSGVCRQMMQRRRVQMTMKKPAQNIRPKDNFLVCYVSTRPKGLAIISKTYLFNVVCNLHSRGIGMYMIKISVLWNTKLANELRI